MFIYIKDGPVLKQFNTETKEIVKSSGINADFIWLIEENGIIVTENDQTLEITKGDLLLKINGNGNQKYLVIKNNDILNSEELLKLKRNSNY